MEGLPVTGLHAVDNYFLVVVLRVKQWCLQRPHGLHPLCHLRVTVGHLEGLRGYRLPVWEALNKESSLRSVGGWEMRSGEGRAWVMARVTAYLARTRVRKACVVALERGSAEDLVNVTKGIYTDS